jgi:hypothetical protein
MGESKMDLYKKWKAEKEERVAAVVDQLNDFGFKSLEIRVQNFIDSLGEELGQEALAEATAPASKES